jgi:glycosyltransferase involved in cell wall biosynthesis
MFADVSQGVLPYRDPWIEDVDTRLRRLSSGHKRIVYFYEIPDTSTFRYRVFNPVQAIGTSTSKELSATWFHRTDLERMSAFIDRADALIICRARYNAAIGRLISRARARGIKILFDVDDLVFDPSLTHLLVETLDQDAEQEVTWDTYFALTSRYAATLQLCDGATTTNEYIAGHLRRALSSRPVRIVPNLLNKTQQEFSKSILARKHSSGFARNEQLHIGYFSGTPTHNRDFMIAARAIQRVMERHRDVMFRIVGFLDKRVGLSESERVEAIPLQDFMNLQRLVGEVEINIAPLQDNVFTNCKSELKYFEAAACGTITVATPTHSFSRAIHDGGNGFLARSYEWEEKLEAAISLVRTRDAYAEMALCAWSHAEKEYSWHNYVRSVSSAIFGDENIRRDSPATIEVKSVVTDTWVA